MPIPDELSEETRSKNLLVLLEYKLVASDSDKYDLIDSIEELLTLLKSMLGCRVEYVHSTPVHSSTTLLVGMLLTDTVEPPKLLTLRHHTLKLESMAYAIDIAPDEFISLFEEVLVELPVSRKVYDIIAKAYKKAVFCKSKNQKGFLCGNRTLTGPYCYCHRSEQEK